MRDGVTGMGLAVATAMGSSMCDGFGFDILNQQGSGRRSYGGRSTSIADQPHTHSRASARRLKQMAGTPSPIGQ